MKKHYDLAVVMPIGPTCNNDFIKDTIESILFYCQCSLKIILSDDSHNGKGNIIKKSYPDVDVVASEKKYGLAGGLYISLSHAFKYAIDHYTFNSLLRIDTDALVTGLNPQKDAEKMFKDHPNIGIAGLHKLRSISHDFNNNIVDNIWPRNHIMRATCTWRFIKRPIGNYALRKYFFKALQNDYELGENVFGGAYFMSESLIKKLDGAGMLPDYKLSNSRLEEDHIFSLLAKVLDFDMGDLASGNLPFGVLVKVLPASPEELHRQGKKIIHSTRRWQNMEEPEIRQYFKNIREADKVELSS